MYNELLLSEFHPAGLSWDRTPVVSVKEGEIIPDFSIKSSPGVKTPVKLVGDSGKFLECQVLILIFVFNQRMYYTCLAYFLT